MGQKWGPILKKNSMLLFLLLMVMVGFAVSRSVSGTAESGESRNEQTVGAGSTGGQETSAAEAEKEEMISTELTDELAGSVAYTFRNDSLLMDHFKKHGDEFEYQSAEEYVRGANRVIASPDALHKIEQDDGDDVYYLEDSNEFVILSKDGYIRTYFKPSAGIDYYNRQ